MSIFTRPSPPCRAVQQQLCEHCLSEFVLSKNSWRQAIKDKCFQLVEIFCMLGKIVFSAAFALLVLLSYLCPRVMSARSRQDIEKDREWQARKDQEFEEELAEKFRFEQQLERFAKGEKFNKLVDEANANSRVFGTSAERHDDKHVHDQINESRHYRDIDSMIELAGSMAATRREQARALDRERERVLDKYKRMVAEESYLIRKLKDDPENEELHRLKDDATRAANQLHRKYQSMC